MAVACGRLAALAAPGRRGGERPAHRLQWREDVDAWSARDASPARRDVLVGSFPAGARENDAYGLGRPGDGVLVRAELVRAELVRAERLPAPYAEGRALLEALGG
ncbi:hypothetical protein GCM10022214_83880 [Actinomadura miaoliensis]|uniref:Uncharacterized protein n=1 Tax=Actinomadura miaoliensis TaxID=430685 RepID=A0ABP7X533_9ACTN